MKLIISTLGLPAIGLICVMALGISIYPGVLNDLLFIGFFLSFLVVPLFIVVGGTVLAWFAWTSRLKKPDIPWKVISIALLMLISTYGMLHFYLPRRLAFLISKPAFEQIVTHLPKTKEGHAKLNQQVGIYWVDEFAVDPRGGTYFLVYAGQDGIGPDRMHYGFCYEPNREGTPFGAASYRIHHLVGDWYWFQASDDFF